MSQTLTLPSVVESWVAEAARGDNVQGRTKTRHTFARPATISNGGIEVGVVCRDISPSGIGLIQTDMPAKQGDHTLTIWLRDRVVEIDVNILWTKKIGRSWWASGGHLMVTAWDSMRLWWDRVRQAANDRRAAPRYTFCHCFLISLDAENVDGHKFKDSDEARELSVASLDISEGGIRFISSEPFASTGRTLAISREGCDAEAAVQGTVRSVYELQNGYYATGVEFTA